MRPLIVVTTTLSQSGGTHRLPSVRLNAQYLTAVEAPGGTGLLLSPVHDPASVRRLVEIAHGLVLTGGEDLDPALYGQEPHPTVTDVNPERDRIELAALEAALGMGMPVLAVCRGLQLLNVARGGTLFQDLPSQRAHPLEHEQEAPPSEPWHHARVREGSRLAQIFGSSELSVNSFHHQGVDRVGSGLSPMVWAEDGLVEGVEGTGYPWLFGVQWHPERGEAHADASDPDRRLFAAFIEAAREFASGR